MISRRTAIASALSLGVHCVLFSSLFFWADVFPVSSEIEAPSALLIRLSGSDSGANAGFGESAGPANPGFPDAGSESNPSPTPSAPSGTSAAPAPLARKSPSTRRWSPELPASLAVAAPSNPGRRDVSAFPAPPSGFDAPPPASRSKPSFQPASPRSIPKPTYPLLARRRGLEGIVLIKLEINVDGVLSGFEFIPPRSSSLLEESVLASIKDIAFTPATIDGRPVQSTLSLKFRFELED